MRLHLCVVGRLRNGPEKDLFSDYIDRFEKTGRSMGLGPVEVIEVEDRKGGGMKAEADLLARAIPKGAVVMVMDERGKTMTSPQFARQLAKWRDEGAQSLAILIGGADGLAPELRARADLALSLGKMVWPHMLARVMLSEQLYRAASILGGSPYHRV
jgi:23S rRNA (pseudouridine1915-N3)-methyltransferase